MMKIDENRVSMLLHLFLAFILILCQTIAFYYSVDSAHSLMLLIIHDFYCTSLQHFPENEQLTVLGHFTFIPVQNEY
jgi:hypothetical protein